MAEMVLFTRSAVRLEAEITAFSFKQKWISVPPSQCRSETAISATFTHRRLSNTYFTNTTPAGATIYIGGSTGTIGTCTAAGATGGVAVLYGANLGTGGVLNSGAPANSLNSGNPVASEYAPIGEFFNSSSGQDVLFVDLLRNPTSFNNIYSFNISSGFTATIANSTIEGMGSSGMVFDNAANTTTFPQASSLYFNSFNQNANCTNPTTGTNTNGCAIKLTQANLQ